MQNRLHQAKGGFLSRIGGSDLLYSLRPRSLPQGWLSVVFFVVRSEIRSRRRRRSLVHFVHGADYIQYPCRKSDEEHHQHQPRPSAQPQIEQEPDTRSNQNRCDEFGAEPDCPVHPLHLCSGLLRLPPQFDLIAFRRCDPLRQIAGNPLPRGSLSSGFRRFRHRLHPSDRWPTNECQPL